MKKKLIITSIVLLVIGVVGYFSFQWYLSTHKAESEVEKVDANEVEEKEETTKGVVINSMTGINGVYISEDTKPVSSEIIFNIGGTTATQGTFKKFDVKFEHTEEVKSIEVIIDPSSVYTAENMRDEHLKGEDFFNIDKFPSITFSSSDIVKGDTSYIAKGSIDFMGLKSSINVPFTYIGQSSEDSNVEIFEGKFDFDRVKYGMEGASGTENDVTISFYCALRKK
jgi:polyisoprenoid-binding protein YceI